MSTLHSIGILGGTFDPIHLGHTTIANDIANTCQLDQVVLIPNHQQTGNKLVIATAAQRLKMVQLAVTDQPKLSASDIEIKRKGKSYTIDTLIALRAQYPQASLSFLMGEDAFHSLDQWQRHDEFLSLCHLIIINRNSHTNLISPALCALTEQHQTFSIKDIHTLTCGKILLQAIEAIDISATDIRNSLNQQNTKSKLDPAVNTYIKEQGLYQ